MQSSRTNTVTKPKHTSKSKKQHLNAKVTNNKHLTINMNKTLLLGINQSQYKTQQFKTINTQTSYSKTTNPTKPPNNQITKQTKHKLQNHIHKDNHNQKPTAYQTPIYKGKNPTTNNNTSQQHQQLKANNRELTNKLKSINQTIHHPNQSNQTNASTQSTSIKTKTTRHTTQHPTKTAKHHKTHKTM